MFNFFKKLKFYAVKTETGALGCCSKSGEPLIGDKKGLKILLDLMKSTDYRYRNCKIVKMKECL